MIAHGTRILCIDDDETIRTIVARALAAVGCEVETAADGLDGLRKGLSGRFDLIICDVMMPHLDGYTVCESIKQNGATTATPLIIMTARYQGEPQLMLGTGYLAKPFALGELRLLVEEALAFAAARADGEA